MTPESPLDALRRLDQEATAAPWRRGQTELGEPVVGADDIAIWDDASRDDELVIGDEDAALIVTLRNTLPALLRLVDAVERWNHAGSSAEYLTAHRNVRTALAELTTPAPAEEESHE